MEKQLNQAKNNMRNYGLDILRCLAMVMVVILHFLDKGDVLRNLADEGSFAASDHAAWILEAFCIVAVNCYMLLSGYFLKENSFKLSRLLGLVCKIWLYSVIVGIIGTSLGLQSDPVDTYYILRLIFPISMGTYWFMTAYIFFYILLPALGIAASRMNSRMMKILIVCLTAFHCIVKSVVPAQMSVDNRGMDVVWYIVLYFIAVYIRRFTVYGEAGALETGNTVNSVSGKAATAKKHNAAFWIILYLIFALLIYGEAMVLRAVYLKTGAMSYIINVSYAYNHIFALAASVCLFVFFLVCRPGEKIGRIFAFLGKYSLGVYLLHENISIRYAWEKLFTDGEISSVIATFAIAVFAGIVVFIAGVIVDFAGTLLFGSLLKFLKKAPVFKSAFAALEKADSIGACDGGK